jgi:hypothetical protein
MNITGDARPSASPVNRASLQRFSAAGYHASTPSSRRRGRKDTAKALIPMMLIGAWNAKAKADTEILSVLANRSYD